MFRAPAALKLLPIDLALAHEDVGMGEGGGREETQSKVRFLRDALHRPDELRVAVRAVPVPDGGGPYVPDAGAGHGAGLVVAGRAQAQEQPGALQAHG